MGLLTKNKSKKAAIGDRQAQMDVVRRRIEQKSDKDIGSPKKHLNVSVEGNSLKIKIGIVCVIGVVGVVVAFWIGWGLSSRLADDSTKEPSVSERTATMNDVDQNSTSSLNALIGTSQTDYETYYAELESANPSEWSSVDVEKAKFCLVYADKVGLDQQALKLITDIRYAASSGVEVYDDVVSEAYVNDLEKTINDANEETGDV